MSKKALVIVGLAAVIAASSGIAYASNQSQLQKTKSFSDVTEAAVSDDNGDAVYDSGSDSLDNGDQVVSDAAVDGEAESSSTSQTETPTSSESGDDGSDPQSQASCIGSFQINRVIDPESGEQQSPRLLFGKYASACYLKLYDNSVIELCLNPFAGTVEEGLFTVKLDRMYVDFGNDKEAVYLLYFADLGGIETVVVPYEGYDIYFS